MPNRNSHTVGPRLADPGPVRQPRRDDAALAILFRTDTNYDSRRNPDMEWVSAGGIAYSMIQRSFDDSGRIQCEARRMNPAAFASLPASACSLGPAGAHGPDRISANNYDAAGQLLLVQRAYGISIGNGFPATLQQDYARYEYTANGKRKAVTDANGNRAEMTYDGFDRQKRWIFPSNTPGVANPADYEEYGYDVIGNRTSLRKRSGHVIGYHYDALNRLVFKDVQEAGGDVNYTYDVRGLQLRALYSPSDHGILNAYDGFGRLVSSMSNMQGTRTYSFQYDAAGNRTRVIHPDGPWFAYDYDAAGRMTALKEWTGATLVTLGYDSAGRRAVAAYANGAVTSYSYDPVGRLTSLTLDLAGAASDVNFAYAYNPASQIVTRTISNDAYVFAKAAASTGYAVNGLNQYTQVGGGAAVHDPNGNLTQEGGRTLGYDTENKLVSASSTAGGTSFNLGYDPQGRLRALVTPAYTTVFDMVGTDIVALRFGSDPPVERYAFAPGVDEPMVGYDNTGTRYFLHADGHGNVVARSDSAGAAIRTIGYDEYGRPSTFNSRFLHAGKMHLGTVNAYYNNARMYDYKDGRFLQTDPIGYDDQINLYAYVSNDPVNQTNPTGTMQDSLERAVQRDDRAYLNGEISEEEYLERQQARGVGGLIGAAGVGFVLTRGAGMPGAALALSRGGIAGLQALLGMRVAMSIPNAQLGAKFASHFREWGLKAGREGVQRFRDIVTRIGTQPDRVVNGTFSGGGEAGRRAVQFRIRGDDVVVTTRKGEFITVLKDGINNASVQSAMKGVCIGSRIARIGC